MYLRRTNKLKGEISLDEPYEGSAAAPTAGLHFTPELLKKIEEKGVKLLM